MIIIGVDYHPSVQQVAFLDTETGETGERRHSSQRSRSGCDVRLIRFCGPSLHAMGTIPVSG
jgi:hypothetical protein